MLKVRVIPIVMLDGYSVVKTIKFSTRRNLGNPITVAQIYNTRNVDELILLDIDASKHEEKIDQFIISEISSKCFMPLTVGGGIRSVDDVRLLLKAGADKVVINSEGYRNPQLIKECSDEFGSQCIVGSVDVKKESDGSYKCYSNGGVQATGKDPMQWIESLEDFGVGEIIINSIDRDGTMAGYDIDLIEKISQHVGVPLIVAGGAKDEMDCVKAMKAGANAISAASIFHFTDITPEQVKNELKENGYPVRKIFSRN
ncbi:MAG: imidazole glycerol phosphate synthase cyclase subunit [Omnitrophica WOR_2 bacterium RIFOXYC2_FULL_38_12]|nr:MAG: imidazole glycerol phosphate synthase cyclase subunit [Omnitrophica WOR_2 bacterium RIFOXYC2_FULL_38_12]